MNKVLLYAIACLFFQEALGQHLVDFSIQNEVCLGEELRIQNNSDEGIAFEWDFCAAQLEGTYATETRGSVTAFMTDISIVNDNGSWYGFVVSRNNLLYKINYGDSPANPPELIESLGNPGSLLNSPEGIDVLKDGNDWYAFITNIGNDIIRVHWENSLEMTPSAQKLNLTSYNKLNGPVQIEIVKDNDVFVAVVANVYSSTITLINLGLSLDNFPTNSDVMESVRLPNAFDTYGVTVVRECSGWVAFAISSGRIYRIDIGSELFSPISLDQITDFTSDLPIVIGSYNHIRATIEGKATYVFFTSYTGRNIAAAIWKEGASNAEYKEIYDTFTFGPYGLDIYKSKGNYGIIVSGYDTGAINHISITSPCAASTRLFNETPGVISYSEPGTFTVSLQVTFIDGVVCSKTQKIIVNSKQAPPIDISITNECVLSPVNFEALNNIDITDYNWDFGDAGSAMIANPTHQYTDAGDYDVSLQVTASNGCNNLAWETITIYSEPTANFNLPAATPICTNQDYLLTNTSTFDSGSNPSWQWEVNGSPVSSDQDLTYSIPSASQQDIKLIASIPGCSTEITKSILTVKDGPLADFTYANGCEDSAIAFTNTTSGTVTSYTWNFGDGNSSGQTNGSNTYVDFGNYDVTLSATNAAGCNNSVVKPIQIYSKPQPNFSLDLPPFSCNGSPSQFNDLTPNPTDSNLTGWVWSFGDGSGGTSISRNPQYTYALAGQYDVNLQATTNFGCTATTQKQITISQSPTTDFSFNAPCVNQATVFVDESGPSISSWQWKIGSSTYTQQNPTHVFGFPSTYNAMLTVTGTNGCIGIKSKSINVPAAPGLDFATENNCSGQNTIFTDASTLSADKPVSWQWQFGTLGSGTGASTQFAFPSPGSYPAKLTVTNQSGCTYSFSKSITIAESPKANFIPTPQSGTPPLIVSFTNTSTNATSQSWFVNNSGSPASTVLSPTLTFDALGDYVVDLIAVNAAGCSDTFSQIISVVVPSLDVALTNLTLIPTTTGEVTVLISLLNNSNSSVKNPKVLLDITGETIISEILPITLLPGQSYSQALTTGVLATKAQLDYVCAQVVVDGDINSVNDKRCTNLESAAFIFDPYPNPASEQLTVEWVAADVNTATVAIFNSIGSAVFENEFAGQPAGLNRLTINLESLNPGAYFMRFTTGNTRKSFRLVIR